MTAGRLCLLHDEGREHVAAVSVGVLLNSGVVICADKECALADPDVDDDLIVDVTKVTAWAAR